MKKEFKIDGMTCNHCLAAVENGLTEMDGMEKVKVNLKKGKATLKFDEGKLNDEKIIQKVEEIGYKAEVI